MKNSPYYLEQIPDLYHDAIKGHERDEQEADRIMLETLREELIEAPITPELVINLYSVARNMGDVELFAADPEHEVGGLLDASRADSRPKKFFVLDGVHGGAHSESEGNFGINLENQQEAAGQLRNIVEKKGFEVKHPGDLFLFINLAIAAHEAGHAILGGISKTQKRMMERGAVAEDAIILATKTYLKHNPQQAFTGNWETDVAIHEERFAEGNAQLVIEKAMRLLGYSDEEVALLESHVSEMNRLKASYHPEGEHQLDYLDQLGAATSAKDAMVVAHGKDDYVDPLQRYNGELGYYAPLTKEEMVAQLKATNKLVLAQDYSATTQSPVEWEQVVRQQQSGQVKGLLAGMKAQRAASLAEEPVYDKSPITSF